MLGAALQTPQISTIDRMNEAHRRHGLRRAIKFTMDLYHV